MKRSFRSLLGIFGSLVLLFGTSGCGMPTLPMASTSTTPVVTTTTPATFTWERVSTGLDRAEAVFSTTTGALMVIYRVSPKQFTAEITHSLPPKHLSVWGSVATGTTLLVNGVYFHEDYLPSGFLQVSGTRIGNRQFDQDKSGVLQFDPFRILDTKAQPISLEVNKNIAQSYPFLVKNGMLGVTEDSGRVARRTFVGVDRDGLMYVGVVPYVPLSLFHLAQFLKQLPIRWTHVLNLDGGPSTGLWMQQGSRNELFDSYVPVPNILLFRPRAK